MKRTFVGFSTVLGVLLSLGLAVAASSNASLETMTVRATGGATLVPVFSPDRTRYEVSLPSDIRAIQVRGSAWVGSSKLKINDQPVASLNWHRIELKPGVNQVVLNVTAPDGSTQRDYIIHSEDDQVVPVAYSRNTIAALRRAGGQPSYTELASGTFFDPNEHWSWVYAYRNEAMREWLFKQSKP